MGIALQTNLFGESLKWFWHIYLYSLGQIKRSHRGLWWGFMAVLSLWDRDECDVVGVRYKSDWSADNSNFIVCARQEGNYHYYYHVWAYFATELGRIIWMCHKKKWDKDLARANYEFFRPSASTSYSSWRIHSVCLHTITIIQLWARDWTASVHLEAGHTL